MCGSRLRSRAPCRRTISRSVRPSGRSISNAVTCAETPPVSSQMRTSLLRGAIRCARASNSSRCGAPANRSRPLDALEVDRVAPAQLRDAVGLRLERVAVDLPDPLDFQLQALATGA